MLSLVRYEQQHPRHPIVPDTASLLVPVISIVQSQFETIRQLG